MERMKRRAFLFGATTTLVAAPAIVQAHWLMRTSVLDPLMINPPDFWMRPDREGDVPSWQAGWWGAGNYDTPDFYPIGSRYEPVAESRVPWSVRHSRIDVYIVRHPLMEPVLPDRVRKYLEMPGWRREV